MTTPPDSRLHTDPAAALVAAAAALAAEGDLQAAARRLEEALAADPACEAAYFGLIDVLVEAEAVELACEAARRYAPSIPPGAAKSAYLQALAAAEEPPEELPPPPGRTGWPWTPEPAPPSPAEAGAPLSIVVAAFTPTTFPEPHRLEETLRSALLQQPPAEVWVVGPPPDARLAAYLPWLAGWATGPYASWQEAVNDGVARCAGAHVAWLCAGEMLCPGALAALPQPLAPGALYEGDCLVLGAAGETLGRLAGEDHTLDAYAGPAAFAAPERFGGLLQPGAIFPREGFLQAGGLGGGPEAAARYALWARMLRGANVLRTGAAFGAVRKDGRLLPARTSRQGVAAAAEAILEAEAPIARKVWRLRALLERAPLG